MVESPSAPSYSVYFPGSDHTVGDAWRHHFPEDLHLPLGKLWDHPTKMEAGDATKSHVSSSQLISYNIQVYIYKII